MSLFEKEAHDTRGTPKPEYRRNQGPAVSLGGPFVQNRLHFFSAFERTNEPKTVTVRTGQSQFDSGVEGNIPAGYERRQLLLRGDLQVSNAHNVFLRYLWDKEYTFCEECGGTMAGRHRHGFAARLAAGRTHVGDQFPRVNEVRSQASALAPRKPRESAGNRALAGHHARRVPGRTIQTVTQASTFSRA